MCMRDRADNLGMGPGQVALPSEYRADVTAQGFWEWGGHRDVCH